MADGEGRVDCDGGVVGVATSAEKGADYAVLAGGATGAVVEDAEEGLWLDLDCEGGGVGLEADAGWAERPREVEGGVYFDHFGGVRVVDKMCILW